MKVLYLDESGSHNMAIIDPVYPVFVLGGIIVDLDYVTTVIEPHLRRLKKDELGDEGVILHNADIMRNRKGFESFTDTNIREQFRARLHSLLRSLDYKVVACAIKKIEHKERYKESARDPYHYSLSVLVERFYLETGGKEEGIIVAEKRGGTLDTALMAEWERLCMQGTGKLNATSLRETISRLDMKLKAENIAGLQLADLIVGPIARSVIGLPTDETLAIIEGKFRRSRTGKYEGYGLKILPA